MKKAKIESITKVCHYCGGEFTLYRKNYSLSCQKTGAWKTRSHCTQSCAAKTKLKNSAESEDPWTDEEINYLMKLIGKKPINLIAQHWNGIAKRKGWYPRTKNALKIKATRELAVFGGSLKSVHNHWDSRTLSRILGTPIDKVRSWRRRGIIEFSKLSRNQTAISRSQLKQFALSHPEELGGIEPKRLRKVLKDGKLVKAILDVANNAPTMGRPITVIRLDTCEVYRSAKSAASAIAIELGSGINATKSRILKTSQRDTPMTNGMDFFRLDYPVYWCPIEIRDRFNQIAGRILCQLYLELKDLGGYSKQSCLTVAARVAVQITLISFRSHQRQPERFEDVDALADWWKCFFFQKISKIIQYDYNLVFKKIQYSIKQKVYVYFIQVAKGDIAKAEGLLEDFTLFFIEKQRSRFSKSYLPQNYLPSDRLQNADLLAFIYGSILIRIDLNDRVRGVNITNLLAGNFVRKYRLNQENTTRYNGDWVLHQGNCTSNNSALELELLLDRIKPKTSPKAYEDIEMYVALKLEDASDSEIVEAMEIGHQELRKLEQNFYALARN